MNFEDIDTVEEEKDLGVVFQQDLKFSNHTATKVNKANSMLIVSDCQDFPIY